MAIDGALNRVSELTAIGKRIPVGYYAVKEINTSFFNKSLSDIDLIHWLYSFFKDTNRFTLDEPNRHMIGRGRWEEDISEKDFLQLFNVMLYIHNEFEYWKEITEFD